jgi:hypothetical protein
VLEANAFKSLALHYSSRLTSGKAKLMGVCTEAELALRQGSLIPLEIPKTDELTGRLEQVAQVS